MNYQALAKSILKTLPSSQPLPKRSPRQQSDDDRIAKAVSTRIQLEMNLNSPSFERSSLLR